MMFALLLIFTTCFTVSPAETNLQLKKSNAALREALRELTQEKSVGDWCGSVGDWCGHDEHCCYLESLRRSRARKNAVAASGCSGGMCKSDEDCGDNMFCYDMGSVSNLANCMGMCSGGDCCELNEDPSTCTRPYCRIVGVSQIIGRSPNEGEEQSVGFKKHVKKPQKKLERFTDLVERRVGKGALQSSSDSYGVKGSGSEKSVGGHWFNSEYINDVYGCQDRYECIFKCKECRRCNKWECIDTECDPSMCDAGHVGSNMIDKEIAVGHPPARNECTGVKCPRSKEVGVGQKCSNPCCPRTYYDCEPSGISCIEGICREDPNYWGPSGPPGGVAVGSSKNAVGRPPAKQ